MNIVLKIFLPIISDSYIQVLKSKDSFHNTLVTVTAVFKTTVVKVVSCYGSSMCTAYKIPLFFLLFFGCIENNCPCLCGNGVRLLLCNWSAKNVMSVSFFYYYYYYYYYYY